MGPSIVRNSREARVFRKQLALLDEATMIGDDKLLAPPINLAVGIPPSVSFDPFNIISRLKTRRKYHLMFIEQLYNSGVRARSIKRNVGKLL